MAKGSNGSINAIADSKINSFLYEVEVNVFDLVWFRVTLKLCQVPMARLDCLLLSFSPIVDKTKTRTADFNRALNSLTYLAKMSTSVPPPLGSSPNPIELSFPLPKAPETLIHLHLTINSTSLLLFLTTSVGGDMSTPASLGTFIYALPDVSQISLLFTKSCRS